MFPAALIVFRESLEAALIICVMAAATRGIPGRGYWLVFGVFFGLSGATLVASGMDVIAELASGMGQELFNAAILSVGVCMLAWHNIWMSVHGRELVANVRHTANQIQEGTRERSIILMVVAIAVLREGAETVLFLYGLATGSNDGLRTTLGGGLGGLAAGATVGVLLYLGLLRIPLRWFFSVTGTMVLLLAASMASQAARFLVQADVLPGLAAPLWDTSAILPQTSALGMLLHGLLGYDAQPSGMQLIFYVTVLMVILLGSHWARAQQNVTEIQSTAQ